MKEYYKVYVYNKKNINNETIRNYQYIGRGNVLGNPFTHILIANTKAEYQVKK